jgi:hypothetical protein
VFRIGAGVVVAFYRVKGDAIVVDKLCTIVDDVFIISLVAEAYIYS